MVALLICSYFVTAIAYSNDIFHHFPASSIVGGLSDEEISLQFTMSWETFLNANTWLDEWDIKNNYLQFSFASLRYQLAFTTYSAASTCSKTPSYRQICKNIITNCIERMIDITTWGHLVDGHWGQNSYHYDGGSCRKPNSTETFWKWAESWPDPVIFQNIMYSGHLAQMLVLFETVTNNNTYSVNGFDLKYNSTLSFHYTTSKLLDALALQMLNENNTIGGIPCEPFRVFTECNQHQNIAFTLYSSAIKNTEYYNNASARFANYLVNKCRKNYSNNSEFQGWVQGTWAQDRNAYYNNDEGMDIEA
eukprot:349323_1